MRWGRWPALSSPRGLSPRQAHLARGATGRRAGSSSVDSPSSRFQIGPSRPHDLHKPSRAAEFASACRLPLSAAAPAADSADFADFVGAADSNTAPTVSKPLLFRQRVLWMNFPAWLGQSIVQPMFVEKSALPILPDEPAAAQICAADSPPVGMAAAAPMFGPTVFFVKPWTIQSVQTHRQPILSTLPISSALPIPTLPPVSKPTLFRQLFL